MTTNLQNLFYKRISNVAFCQFLLLFLCYQNIFDMKKIVIFASGSGSNAENIIKHFVPIKTVTVVAVLTNNCDAKVIDRAKKLHIPTEVFSKKELEAGKVLEKLHQIQPDLIILAGFLLKFPEHIVKMYPNKIINIHPALLPKYGGKGMYGENIHKAVIEAKEPKSGITIHYVNENYDEGKVIFKASCKIKETDDIKALESKIHHLEHLYFPEIINSIVNKIKF